MTGRNKALANSVSQTIEHSIGVTETLRKACLLAHDLSSYRNPGGLLWLLKSCSGVDEGNSSLRIVGR